jgi:hypothetical protein
MGRSCHSTGSAFSQKRNLLWLSLIKTCKLNQGNDQAQCSRLLNKTQYTQAKRLREIKVIADNHPINLNVQKGLARGRLLVVRGDG